MIKRDVTETVYEYDKEGKLIKKTVTETHEEDSNTFITYPYHHYPQITCNTSETNKIQEVQQSLFDYMNTDSIHTYDQTLTTAHNGCVEEIKCNCVHK